MSDNDRILSRDADARAALDAVLDAFLEAQDEVSFAKGQDSAFDTVPENLPPLLETAHRSGMVMILKLLTRRHIPSPAPAFAGTDLMFIRADVLGAKLDEWGIKWSDIGQ